MDFDQCLIPTSDIDLIEDIVMVGKKEAGDENVG